MLYCRQYHSVDDGVLEGESMFYCRQRHSVEDGVWKENQCSIVDNTTV